MGSTSYLARGKAGGRGVYGTYRPTRSASSVGSDRDTNGKLKRTKPRRSGRAGEFGLKRSPDYTELAYKEAVSKLRYFLSGNLGYRSYGSVSIKNLDESDGEERKYAPAQLSSVRPRLTAKYSQLYADSLHNYNANDAGSKTSSGPAPEPSANPDVVHFIQKQEEYIEQLERESQYCRDELNSLLGKVKEVISENEHLHEAQKDRMLSRMFDARTGAGASDSDEPADSTGLDSDHRVTPSKVRKASRPARSARLEGPSIVFESRISELEAQLTQANIQYKKIQDENNEIKRKLAEGLVDTSCLDGFKRQIDNLQRDKASLEAQVSKLKLSLEQSDSELGSRLKRGSDLVEQQLREERNNLEAEVRRLKEELNSQRGKVRELTGEGARRVVQERSAAEQCYTVHLDELAHDLAAQYDNVSKLQLDLERQRREEHDLKRELAMKTAALDELKMELKSKTASLQADLAQAHAEKSSVEEELASARLAIERHQRQAKHETNRLNSEIQSLRQRLDRADADLVHSRRENLRLSEEIAKLEKDLKLGNLTPASPVKSNKDKELASMLESMENKHAHTVAELEAMIQSQNSLMDKLTGECRLLTDKLDHASRRHKQSAESQPIRSTNQNTARRQRSANNEPTYFEAPRKRVRFVEEELAALQRQVEGISQSFQQPAPSRGALNTNMYQAPASSIAHNEDNSRTNAFTNNVDTRPDTTRLSNLHRQSPESSYRNDSNGPTRTLTKRPSNESFSADKPVTDNQSYLNERNIPPDKFKEKADESTEKEYKVKEKSSLNNQNAIDPAVPNVEMDQNQDYTAESQYTGQSYDADQTDYSQPQYQAQPEPAYDGEDQTYSQEPRAYQASDYNQETYPSGYTEGQYENQEQYPNQEYTGQNAQKYSTDQSYEQQSYDYSADPNYQSTVEPNYQGTAQPDYPTTADPNYQSTLEPNYQHTTQPTYVDSNYPTTAEPNYQSSAQPNYPNSAETSYQTGNELNLQTAGRPSYPNTTEPSYASTVEPNYQSTVDTSYQSTENPNYQNPVDENYQNQNQNSNAYGDKQFVNNSPRPEDQS